MKNGIHFLAVSALGLAACTRPAANAEAATLDALHTACETEATKLASDPNAHAVAIVVLDAQSGTLLATAGRRRTENVPDLPQKQPFNPGSVMKTFTFGTAIDKGVLDPNARFVGGDANGYSYEGEHVHDAEVHGPMSADDVLAFSSNIGSLQVFDLVGQHAMATTFRGVQLGDITHASKKDAAFASTGEGSLTPTPVALASAFRAMAVDGVYKDTAGNAGDTVAKPETAATLRAMLEHTVTRADGTAHSAEMAGYRVAGKTGTSVDEHDKTLRYADFVGVVPASAPRFVILVGVSTTAEGYSGGTIAAPGFAHIAKAVLADAHVPTDK